MNQFRILLAFLILIAINAALAGAYYYGLISLRDAFYILWGEVILVSIGAFLIYAKHLVVFFTMLLLAAGILSLKGGDTLIDIRVPVTFWVIYAAFWLVYFEFNKSAIGQTLRYHHPFYNLSFYLTFMATAIIACFSITATIYNGWDVIGKVPQDLYMLFFFLAAIIPTVSIGALKIIDIIGGAHVFHFLTGTYHRPVTRQRIVLFLDMAGSSAIAEKLEPKVSMALIARFIYDASHSFRIKGGDIVNYTGDGLVVLWPINKADQAVQSVEILKNRLDKNIKYYQRNFGIVPGFRIGIHSGEVIMSQIGEEKLFIGLHGDVVNTSARLEQLCKELGVQLLFSKNVRQYMSVKMKQRAKHLGRHEVRGKQEKIDVFTLLPNPKEIKSDDEDSGDH